MPSFPSTLTGLDSRTTAMFARIYTGIFLSVLLAAAVSFGLYLWSHQLRWPQYEVAALRGTMQLISESLAAQPAERQTRYLDIVARLLGADTSTQPLTQLPPAQLRQLENGQAVKTSLDEQSIHWCLPLSEDQCAAFRIPALSEQQYRALALLLVAELSKNETDGDKQAQSIHQLQRYSAYPLAIANAAQLQLDRQQLSRLGNNAVVVATDYQRDDSFTVFAPLEVDANSGRLVQLGPVPRYRTLPTGLVMAMIAITAALMAATAYWLVRQLEVRLLQINHTVARFGNGDLKARVETRDADQIGALAGQVNTMAERIENHIEGERSLIQAVSHDFRTPLSRMRFRIEMLGNDLHPDNATNNQSALQRVDSLNRDVGELQSLVNEVLEQHELGSQQQIELIELQPNQLINNVVDSLSEIHPGIQITTRLGAPNTLPANARFFSRLLLNLTDNACKHAHQHVTISTSTTTDNRFRLSVDDDGNGIHELERSRVFENFYRADTSRNRETGGFGLGLSIVKRIADLHQASIELDDSQHGGARFTVEFPRSNAAA